MAKSSINFKPCKVKISEAHNERTVKLDYIMPGREGRHEHWKETSIAQALAEVKELYQEKVGRNLSVTAVPIREAVVNIKPDTQIHELRKLGNVLKAEFGIRLIQVHTHHDEGHIASHEEAAQAKAAGDRTVIAGMPKINHHAHLLFVWQDQTTGRSIKLRKDDLSKIQTITAEILGMERGQTNSKAVRLEAREYKTFAQQLAQDVSKAKLEASAEVEKHKEQLAREVAAIEARKKPLMIGLQKSENDLKALEQKLETKLDFTRQLEKLNWRECTPNIAWWLNGKVRTPDRKYNLERFKVNLGQDGSIYFTAESAGQKFTARLKDMKPELHAIIREKVSKDRTVNRSQAKKLK